MSTVRQMPPRAASWRGHIAVFIAVITLQGLAQVSWGAEWSIAPAVGTGIFYDSNPGLTSGGSESSSGAYANAILGTKYATERSQANLGAAWYGTRYREEGNEDTSEGVIELRSDTRVTERQTFGLDGEYRRGLLLEQRAQTEAGTGDIRDTDVGSATVKRVFWWAEPYWGFQITERNAIDIRYRQTEARYDAILDDYDDHVGSIAFVHALNPRDKIRFGVRRSRYRSSSADTRATTDTVFVGFGRAFTPTTNMEFYLGSAKAEEEVGGETHDVTGYVFRALFNYRTELTSLEGVISRDAHPSGGGRLVASDQIRIDMYRNVTERSVLWLRAIVFRDHVLEGEDPALDRTYGDIEPGYRWNWSPVLAVSTSYRYRQQKYETDTDAAKSNTVFVGITYSWPRSSISR